MTGVRLDDGSVIAGDFVCVGVGARPNTGLFEGQLEMHERPMGGVKVSATLETSQPGLLTHGHCNSLWASARSRSRATLICSVVALQSHPSYHGTPATEVAV